MHLFVNDLTVMDFSYLCPKRGMVGESWIVDVVLNGALNEESMVLDFGKVKKELKYLIDEYVDHKLLVPAEHAFVKLGNDHRNDNVIVNFVRPEKEIALSCPPEAYAFIYAEEVTMESVSQYLKEIIATHLPENVDDITLSLRTEVIDGAFYHYTHGLKKHDGNCQRIAHGHRSKILVKLDGQFDEKWQRYWANRWSDIYIGTTEDIVAASQLSESLQKIAPQGDYYCFAYESSQGEFELIIPKAESEIVDTDSTVECLAQYLANEQAALTPDTSVEVVAFEGVGKGAIAYA
ncbi:6-carboxytetrahydropterin synthase [Planctobacterium marinum]|uniref:6-carboxytetrahydropterin synthase n=1 Tax=Planctobacterium marinum TaxID=1631968 RepID=UPI001E4D5C5E|nr:6-carboxytetrahydropterin synthase [Planctobacterium marinum]MCC2604243.1 6-carboxytetrahydropterin synthase [Planctobacterium marinum]